MPLLRRGGRSAEPRGRPGSVLLSAAVRLLAAPGLILAAALLAYALPGQARRWAQLLAALATVIAGGLLLSVLALVGDGGRVEASAGSLARGVPLTLRADQTAIWIGLLACGACLLGLADGRRSTLERSGLLLCLGGTLTTCLAGNAVLLVAGLELGNAGALLLTVGASPSGRVRRAGQAGFAVQHLASLGLLASAVELIQSQGTADLAALPPGAITVAVAVPWGLCGLVRLAAAAAIPVPEAADLPSVARPSTAWVAVAAVPSGLVVLLRLVATAGGHLDAVAPAGAHLLVGAGLTVALGGAVVAVSEHRRPVAAGRALCVSAAGQVVILVGAGGAGALIAASALATALLLAVLAATAWAPGSGPWVRALALAVAGGLPCGAGAAAMLAAAGSEVAPGGGGAVIGALAGGIALLAAVGGAMAAADVLGGDAVAVTTRSGIDVGVALAASAALALLPGVLLGGLADRIAESGSAVAAVDSLAVRGPGFGWSGGYLAVAALVAVAAALSAVTLQGTANRDPSVIGPLAPIGGRAAGPASVMAVMESAAPGAADAGSGSGSGLVGSRGWPGAGRVAVVTARLDRWLLTVDHWLVRQPDVPVIVIAAVVVLLWVQYRP